MPDDITKKNREDALRVEQATVSYLDKLLMGAVANTKILGSYDDPAREMCPLWWQWMTQCAYDDRVVVPARLMIQGAQGGFTIQMVHGDLASSVECPVTNILDWPLALEEYLGSPKCVVKTWGKKLPKLRRKEK